MSLYTISPQPWLILLDDDGALAPAGTLTVYDAGTTDLSTVYKTSSGTAHLNPIPLDAAGRVPMGLYLVPGRSYDFLFKDAAGATVKTQPNIAAVPLSSSNEDVVGTLGENVTAGDPLYLSDGSGALIAGRWYKTDADLTYASITPQVGLVTAAGSTGESAVIRKGGSIDLTTPLTPGADYFISATPGVLTVTAPANARYIGQAASTTMLILATPDRASVLAQKVRIQATVPYALTLPTADGAAGSALVTDGAGQLSFGAFPFVFQGRLTLTTGTAVTTGDVTSSNHVYWTPYNGNWVSVYVAGVWRNFQVSADLDLNLTNSTIASGSVNDVFIYSNSGTLTLERLAWTNTTTRATALALQNGVLVKSGDPTRLYVGTIYGVGANATSDAVLSRSLWNTFNRVERLLRVVDVNNTWAPVNTSWRQANASAANQVEAVVGVAIDPAALLVEAYSSSSGADIRYSGVGDNLTSAPATLNLPGRTSATTNQVEVATAYLRYFPAIGYHAWSWLEKAGSTAGSVSFLGDNGDATLTQSGLVGTVYA